jgi:hypothetical protein
MPVVNAQGLVGRIIFTGPNHSIVMPYIDIRNRISAKLQGLQTGGIVSWDGKRIDELMMSTIPRTVQVDSGMVVETSGFSNDLPPNIPIGTVLRSVPDPGKDTQTLYLRPFVNLFEVSESFVIRGRFVITDLLDRHGGMTRQDFRQIAFAVGGKVHDDHVREPEVVRDRREKVLQRFDATGGRADRNHRRRWSLLRVRAAAAFCHASSITYVNRQRALTLLPVGQSNGYR